VLCFTPVVGIGTPPTPPAGESAPPPLGSWGRGTLAGERGVGSPNSDEGTYTLALYMQDIYMYMYCVFKTVGDVMP
jgi:hypothetical protein